MNNAKVMCFDTGGQNRDQQFLRGWGKPEIPGLKPLWESYCNDSVALAVCRNAVILATASELAALDLRTGQRLWRQSLPAAPVPWGLAVDRAGRVIVTLENGEVLAFGNEGA